MSAFIAAALTWVLVFTVVLTIASYWDSGGDDD